MRFLLGRCLSKQISATCYCFNNYSTLNKMRTVNMMLVRQ